MLTQLLLLTGVFSRLAAADSLSLYLGTACNGADEGFTSPLPLGTCIEFNQAQSFILNTDDGNVCNLYGDGGCAQFVGEVALKAVGDTATALMNIGPQSSKRWIRGATAPAERVARAAFDGSSVELSQRTVLSPNGVSIQKRVEGATYRCPNVPSGAAYFFVVQSESTTDEKTNQDEDTTIPYQNPSGQTTVSSFTPLDARAIRDVQVTLTMQQGVIQDIQGQDIDTLMSSLNDFRDGQSGPINFLVSLYTCIIGHADAGIIANWQWNGDSLRQRSNLIANPCNNSTYFSISESAGYIRRIYIIDSHTTQIGPISMRQNCEERRQHLKY
ncbi:hypothetical protein DFH09DRAFT_1459944 [Mycena vulgaris]|nr:hypothetical protein DFH09DRAFT_1459944 [Mycena vulgaris]